MRKSDMMSAGSNDDGDVPDFDRTIREYDGAYADDAADDRVGIDEDIYWEANTFDTKVKVFYNGNTVDVECGDNRIQRYIDGAHLVIDMQQNEVKGVEIELSGKSDNGSLKIYGNKKFKLSLNGVELTSLRGPAINNQCKKRCFVHLAAGSLNRLTDAAKYSDDWFYPEGVGSDDEDRKGCFFSEGNMIFSGTGALLVAGRKKHGIASDGYFYTRPGVTIAVTEAGKNAIHVKGDSGDNKGICITGGLIYACVASDAGKCMKTDLNVEISGGKLDLNTSGNAVYDADEYDTSSAAGIKSDGDIRISKGTVSVKSIGTGGKGISADGNLTIDGGKTVVVTTGGKYRYSSTLTSSPKGVKAKGRVDIDGGELKISVTGVSDGSEGLECKSIMTINDGDIYVYAYDDAINVQALLTVNGGQIYAYSVNNDGIDSNGRLTFNGGVVIASGSNAPEEAFDCDRSDYFKITGGTLIGTSGASISPSASTQRTVIYNGITVSKGEKITILDADGSPIVTYTVPRSINNGLSFFFSSPRILSGETYTVSKGGTLSGASGSWNGWYSGGSWSGGSQIGTFTSNSIVTVIGNSGGPGGGFPGGGMPPGGR